MKAKDRIAWGSLRASLLRWGHHQPAIPLAVSVACAAWAVYTPMLMAIPTGLGLLWCLVDWRKKTYWIWVFIFLSLTAWFYWRHQHQCSVSWNQWVEGTVVSTKGNRQWEVELPCGGHWLLRSNQLLRHSKPLTLIAGDKIRFKGAPREIKPATNPGQWDLQKFLQSKNLKGALRTDSLNVLETSGSLQGVLALTRERLIHRLSPHVLEPALPLVQAMLFGARERLDPALKTSFANSGMYHLLAVSGLHVGVIGFLTTMLFKLLRMPHKAAYLSAALILALYIPLAGYQISVIRTVIMFWVFTIAVLLERRPLTLQNLAWAAIISLLWRPWEILGLGFHLSFGATFFLVHYAPVFQKILERGFGDAVFGAKVPGGGMLLKSVVGTLGVSLLLFLVTLPLLANTLHQVSPLAILGNVLTLIQTSAVVFSGVITLAVSFLSHTAADWVGAACTLASIALIKTVALLAGTSWSYVHVPSLPWTAAWGLWLWLGLLPLLARAGWARWGRPFLFMGVAYVSVCFAYAQVKRLIFLPVEVILLDAGQGDAALLELPGGYRGVIDLGRPGTGQYTVLPALKQAGWQGLDFAVITHGDWDHYGGLEEIVGKIPIGKVITNGKENHNTSWEKMKSSLKRHGIPRVAARCGDTLYHRQSVVLKVESPCRAEAFSKKNDASLVLSLQAHGKTVLLTGDIESEAEEWLVRHYHGPVDYLKVPHHGSATSSALSFLRHLHPGAALVSVGQRNSYGLPSPEVVERYAREGVPLFGTHQRGALCLRLSRLGDRLYGFRDGWRTVTVGEIFLD